MHSQASLTRPRTQGALDTPEAAIQLRDLLRELRELRELLIARRKPTLTVDEVAELVGRDPYTVRTWIKRGRLRAVRVQGTGPRGRLLIDRGELDRLLVAGRAGNVPDAAMP